MSKESRKDSLGQSSQTENPGVDNVISFPEVVTPEVEFYEDDYDIEEVSRVAKKSAVQVRKELLEQLLSQPEVDFMPEEFGPRVHWKEQLVAWKDEQKRQKRIKRDRPFATININKPYPIGIALTSDWHLGSEGTAYDLWQKDMELIMGEPNAYMVTLSNVIDNAVFEAAMYNQLSHPYQQMTAVRSFVHDSANKYLTITGSSCHEGWTRKKVNIDIVRLMFSEVIDNPDEKKQVPYMTDGGVLTIRMNGSKDVKYSIGLKHKARGGGENIFSAPRNMALKLWPGIDIAAVAHNHVRGYATEKVGDAPFERELHYFRTGAYKVKDEYGESEGFPKGQPGSPMVVLYPFEKKIMGFTSIEDGVRFLQDRRKEYDQIFKQEERKRLRKAG